jgi:hypothetical protein
LPFAFGSTVGLSPNLEPGCDSGGNNGGVTAKIPV